MESIIGQMINEVWGFPRGTKIEPGGRKNPDNLKHYRKWGFTIYRTYYGKESDKYWQSLLYSLRHQTKLAFGAFEDDENTDQDDRRRIQELFQLEICDDPSLLDGLDARGLRELCNAKLLKETQMIEKGSQTVRVTTRPRQNQSMADYLFGFVFLADEAVLKDIERGECIVKAVSLHWDGYAGWGWVRIPTGYLLDLWTYLMWNDDRLESCLYFRGSEEDLADQVWPGEAALPGTGRCSEIRFWRHYENQNEMY